jgi:hypothetical protein
MGVGGDVTTVTSSGAQVLEFVSDVGDDIGIALVAVLIGLIWWQVHLRWAEANEACEYDNWEERSRDTVVLTVARAVGYLVSQLMYVGPWSEKYLRIGYSLAYALIGIAVVVVAVRLVSKCNRFYVSGDDDDEADDGVDRVVAEATGEEP